jgi:hypothetical protein
MSIIVLQRIAAPLSNRMIRETFKRDCCSRSPVPAGGR